MSVKAVSLAEQGKAITAKKKSPRRPSAAAPLAEKVRLSADIAPEAYRALVSWCQDVALAVGRTRVQHVWVIRALVDELYENAELQTKIIERIREDNLDN